MSPSSPSFSICICTYKRPNGLARLLKAVVAQFIDARDEIIVVNDGSPSAQYAEIADNYSGIVRFIQHETNRGIAQARNTAANAATHDYVIFIDDDCLPSDWWLDWISARLETNPEIDILAGDTYPLEPDSGPTFMSRMQGHFGFIPGCFNSDGNILFPTANVAIRRSLLLDLGGFGFPGQFHGAGEDTEFASRANAHGARIVIEQATNVGHDTGEPFFGLCRRYWRYGFANGAMLLLTTSPPSHTYLRTYRYLRLPQQWRYFKRLQLRRGQNFHGNRLEKWLAVNMATFVRVLYEAGAITGYRSTRSRILR